MDSSNHDAELEEEPSIDADKLSYEIFSILETNFLFGHDQSKFRLSNQLSPGPEPPLRNQRGKVCILAVDGGGGMRGVLAGKALAYLENAIKKKSGNINATIADYFDVAAGSGIGGIFAAMLFATEDRRRPIFHAEDTWKLLVERGKNFYHRPRSGSGGFFRRIFKSGGSVETATSGLEKTVKEAFVLNGRSLTLKDTLKPVLIPCYDLSSSAPFLFSRAAAVESDSFDFRLWEVCMATSAEPGQFEPVTLRSVDGRTECVGVDGGLAMVNPTGAAITHVVHNKEEFPMVRGVEDLLVLSIGTGQALEIDYGYEQVKRWKPKDWARPTRAISGDGSADLVDQAVGMAFAHAGTTSNYVRIQANGTSMGRCVPNLDRDASGGNVKILAGIADEMLKQKNVESVLFGGKRISEHSNCHKLDWFAGQLVEEHQRRSRSSNSRDGVAVPPTVAFKQVPLNPT